MNFCEIILNWILNWIIFWRNSNIELNQFGYRSPLTPCLCAGHIFLPEWGNFPWETYQWLFFPTDILLYHPTILPAMPTLQFKRKVYISHLRWSRRKCHPRVLPWSRMRRDNVLGVQDFQYLKKHFSSNSYRNVQGHSESLQSHKSGGVF